MTVAWVGLAVGTGLTIKGQSDAKNRADAAAAQQSAGVDKATGYTREAAARAETRLQPVVNTGDAQVYGINDDIYRSRVAGNTGTDALTGQLGDLDVAKFLDPSMKFTMDEGLAALKSSQAARGLLNSGGAMREIAKYSQGLASTNYNNAVSQAMTNRGQQAGIANSLVNLGTSGTNAALHLNDAGNIGRQSLASIDLGQGVNQGNLSMTGANIGAAGTSAQPDFNKTYAPLIGSAVDLYKKNYSPTSVPPQTAASSSGGWGSGDYYGNQDMGVEYSDEQLKDHIDKIGESVIEEFMNSINPKTFEYNDKGESLGAPDDDRVGILAQDIEKSAIGKKIVKNDSKSGYKQIDIPQSVGALMASVSVLNDKIDRLGSRK